MLYRKMATYTADNSFSYSKTVNGKTLLEHAEYLNRYLESMNGWSVNIWPPPIKLLPGLWGTDVYVSRIASALPLRPYDNVDSVAERMHEGWCKCYTFWLNTKPWLTRPEKYKRPNKNLLSRSKLNRLYTNYEDLNDYHKNLYKQMAVYVLKNC